MSMKRTYEESCRAASGSNPGHGQQAAPPLDGVKQQLLQDIARKRYSHPQNDEERQLEQTIDRRRLARRRWNKKHAERTGRRITMSAIDHVKRTTAGNEELDYYSRTVFEKTSRQKFLMQLSNREQGWIEDPGELVRKERERQLRLWLATSRQFLERKGNGGAGKAVGAMRIFHDWKTAMDHLAQVDTAGFPGARTASIRVLQPDAENETSDVKDVSNDEFENEEEMDIEDVSVLDSESSEEESDTDSEDE
ncbi:hypothetical protein HDE_12952 [Halotydeus destructor]|nr:hypothetical protein HDE_12952 [Halotydeus destructor]